MDKNYVQNLISHCFKSLNLNFSKGIRKNEFKGDLYLEISKLMSQILTQSTLKPINAKEISSGLNLNLRESEKVLKQLEKMGLLECFFQPTDFARELMKLEAKKAK